ncbi:YdcF family protein [Kordiimonas sp. SCSIO 12610]|uniref:YdcF family protein n=1 Tax=Kordiimonas sp. SCSIO 12610 TaxID=2829597 RepID=UPI0021087B0D|nr:YdcF family protein [Kordiimonas sp. SCSIO 12610]UTW55151.1 YdcF family protein [Kordiimonas sp. SCSIO 12610]
MKGPRKRAWYRTLYKIIFYSGAAWLIGLGFFYVTLPKPADINHDNPLNAEALIVLTGGKNRLETALDILKKYPDKRLLISGVNPIVEQSELRALTGSENTLFDCCVDIDQVSENTAANAVEGSKWIQKNKFQTVIIITADYHIRRSMMLFQNQAPQITFTGHAVQTDADLSFLAREYNKYLFTVIQLALGITPNVRVTQTSALTASSIVTG